MPWTTPLKCVAWTTQKNVFYTQPSKNVSQGQPRKNAAHEQPGENVSHAQLRESPFSDPSKIQAYYYIQYDCAAHEVPLGKAVLANRQDLSAN